MKYTSTKLFFYSLLLLFFTQAATAQKDAPLELGLDYIRAERASWGLTENDIADLRIRDMYTSTFRDVTHIYLNQQHQGVDIFNAITSVHITSDGRVFNVGHRFIPNVQEKINTTTPTVSAADALSEAIRHLDLPTATPQTKQVLSEREVLFDKEGIAHTDILVQLCYQPTPKGDLRLAWDMAIDQLDRQNYWSLRVDAVEGTVISQNNWMTHCRFVDNPYHRHTDACMVTPAQTHRAEDATRSVGVAGTYNVLGELIEGVNSPIESPIHGTHNLLSDPHDVVASPYGWHDTNGEEGPEYTITRGNNVHAYLDTTNQSIPVGEPDGGENLVFDFPYDPLMEPETFQDAAITNLFYMNNSVHDFAYHLGFDEPSGNFQRRNYTGEGAQNDYVLAEGQDGGGENNANFATPPDGSNGVMQMYLWSANKLLTINSPFELEGFYNTGTADFGPDVTETPINGDIVLVNDGGENNGTFGCNPILNDLEGKVALIDRGGCFFEQKAANAEARGAIAAIICNFENATMGMAGVPEIDDPTIPTISISSTDCLKIKTYLGESVVDATIVIPDIPGPDLLDASLDNGIIAHEYAHGISNRMTGGPSAAGCLSNGEQMGEGWSDFFTLVTTVKPTDDGTEIRGVGTYPSLEDTNGNGIRPYPYSTDMSINPTTYENVNQYAGSIHDFGSVWTQMLWDMYWAFVEEYGFDIDYSNPEAGNNIAVRLVMDGMRYQPCNPGFIDGRDAILAADIINYEGANQCLIWKAFAKRGMGHEATQGSTATAGDGMPSYDPLPECVKEVRIDKVADESVVPGQNIDYTITVTNYKDEAVTGVVVTDEIPEGCSYVSGSANEGGTASNGIVEWQIDEMSSGETKVFTYQATTPSNIGSVEIFKDDFEDPTNVSINWTSAVTNPGETENAWAYINDEAVANSGTRAFTTDFSSSNGVPESDQFLLLTTPVEVSGTQPVLRFFHEIDSQGGLDGGFVQASYDAENWFDMGEHIFKNPYTGFIDYQTFVLPNLRGYWGTSEGYIDSYIDLSAFMGEILFFRWRFGSNEDLIGGEGWSIDDVTYLDMVNYNGEACVATAEGDNACAVAPYRGTIAGAVPTSVKDVLDKDIAVQIFPNPTQNVLTVDVASPHNELIQIQLVSIDGKVLQERRVRVLSGVQREMLNVSSTPSGFYFVKIATPRGMATEKVVIE